MSVIVRSVRGALIALAIGAAVPAAAQGYSPAHKFLDAVDKKKGDEVIAMLSQPGSTLINSRELESNRTALHIVVERRDITWLNFLLAKGADPNLADSKGVTPLLLAVRMGFVEAVDSLVKNHARLDDSNDAGETPLISAVHARNIPMIRVLLAAGADPDHTDNSGRSARDYAKLDGEQSAVMTEIAKSAKGNRGASGGSYGPSL